MSSRTISDSRLRIDLGPPLSAPRPRVAILRCEPGSDHVARFTIVNHESSAIQKAIPAARAGGVRNACRVTGLQDTLTCVGL